MKTGALAAVLLSSSDSGAKHEGDLLSRLWQEQAALQFPCQDSVSIAEESYLPMLAPWKQVVP